MLKVALATVLVVAGNLTDHAWALGFQGGDESARSSGARSKCSSVTGITLDSVVGTVLEGVGGPHETAHSYLRVSLAGVPAEQWSVVVAPNERVHHGQLFGIVAAQCFWYLGDRGGYLTGNRFAQAVIDWNERIQMLGGDELVAGNAQAVGLTVLFLTLATGEVSEPRADGAFVHVHRVEPQGGLSLPRVSNRVEIGVVGIEQPLKQWTVNATWWKCELRVRFSSTGLIVNWETNLKG